MLAVKPLPFFAVLDQHLLPKSTPFTLLAQSSITLEAGERKVTVVRSGTMKITRQPDDILMSITTIPLIVGLPDICVASETHRQMTALTPCEVYQLDVQTCWAVLDKHRLWKEAFQWVSWQFHALEMRDTQLVGQSTYKQIRASLQLMANWNEALRARVGVIHYIQQRTHISRSVIAEVLAALRAGNYIEMSKGKLLSVNRLPLEY